jgi:hypothetical protein
MKIKILLTVIAISLTPCSRGEDKDNLERVADQKVYVINLAQERNGYVLTEVESADFNGIKCLIGRHVDMSWVKGKICYIPIETVSVIVEFDSLEDYKESLKQLAEDRMK